ncbi:MAG TPA: response regulator [Thermoflexia bacterium]|nr:response regulator [Thermoflexia bacterium]
MSAIYLTPASLSYLTQFILALAITLFLACRWRNRNTPLVLLTVFFAGATSFIGLLFLDVSLAPFPRLLAVYAENTVLALALVFLLQFAYRFPRFYAHRKWEAYASLSVSLVYFLWEAQYMVYRYVALLQWETVYYRPPVSAYVNALVLLWVPIAFSRQTTAADPRPVHGLLKLWQPQGQEARGARSFVLVFGIIFVLGVIDVLRIFSLSTMFYNAALSLGILVALWLFAINYIHFVPGGVSVLTKLSILTLTMFLALLGLVGWMIAPSYIATYRPDLTDHQTLRFVPNVSGGYDVALVDFSFETELGDRVQVQPSGEARNHEIDFAFPFYGQSYTQIYVASSGVIGMGEPFWQPNMQARRAHLPAIFPLLIELDPRAGGGLYARQEPDRLILTWDHLPALYRPEAIFTFQAVLYQDGVFDITYNGLPLPFRFDPDETPSANPWLRGATPGRGESLHTRLDDLTGPLQEGQGAIIQNYHLDFRRYLHTFILPLGWVVIGGSLLLMAGLPALLHFSIIRPLNDLAAGVRQMEAGDLNAKVLIHNQDEIGFLAYAFNGMASRLSGLVTDLEERVAARTSALDATNAQLRAEIAEREQAQATSIEQQRTLATMEERERMGRDLHDGLGQTLGYLNVQAQAVETMLAAGQTTPAQANLRRIVQAAQEANADIRDYILGLRAAPAPRQDFLAVLRDYLHRFQTTYGIETRLNLPADAPSPVFGPAVEEQLLRIIQEALTNVRKHAAAHRVEVLFDFAVAATHVIITDDGCGFDVSQRVRESAKQRAGEAAEASSSHLGLTMMRERAQAVGGQMEIRSAPEQGACILVHIPRLVAAPGDDAETAGLAELRLLLVDDHPLFLEGLHSLLTARGFTVVGTACDGEVALEQSRALRPDVVVMDMHMPGGGGLEATRAIKAELPETKIIMLTVAEDDAHLFAALESGASGYLLKNLDANQFCALLAGLLRDESPLAPGLAARIMAEFSHRRDDSRGRPDMTKLTPRQKEILSLVAQGLIYKEVAQRLHLTEQTVKYHINQILEKLHVENRAEAIAYYLRAQ